MSTLHVFRSVLGLALVALLLAASSLAGQATNKLIDEITKKLKELPRHEPKTDDSPLRKLLIQRYNVALEEATQRCDDYKKGLSTMDQVILSSRELLTAELEMLTDPQEKIAALERVIGVLRWYEREQEAALKEGIGLRAELLRTRHRRLDLEIQVLQVKGKETAAR